MPLRRTLSGDATSQSRDDGVARALRALENTPARAWGTPSDIISSSKYTARLGEMVRLNPSSNAITVTLPRITAADIGRTVTVVNVSSSTNTVTVAPPAGRTDTISISGRSTYSIAKAYFRRTFVAVTESLWIDESHDLGPSSDGLPVSWFEWNGDDLTQFDSSVDGESTTAVTWSVVTKYGVNWVKGAITTAGAASPYAAGGNALHYGSILPISQTPPSANYIVTAEVKFDLTISAAKGGAAMVMRYVNGATCYCYTAGRYSANTAESYYFGAARDLTPDQLYRVASFAVTENHAPVMYDESGGFGTQYSGFHLKGGVVGEMLIGSGGGNNWCTSPISTSMAFWTGYAVNTSAGQAGILATNTGATTGTCNILFRNIRCYDASMIGVL